MTARGAEEKRRAALQKYLGAQPAGTRVALETGGQPAWVRDVITGLGHEAVVANARELAAVTASLQRTCCWAAGARTARCGSGASRMRQAARIRIVPW